MRFFIKRNLHFFLERNQEVEKFCEVNRVWSINEKNPPNQANFTPNLGYRINEHWSV